MWFFAGGRLVLGTRCLSAGRAKIHEESMTTDQVNARPLIEGPAFRVRGLQGAVAVKPEAGCWEKKWSRAAKVLFGWLKRLAVP